MPSKEEVLQELLGTMSDMDEATPYVRAMFYGDSGTGKTVLAMQTAQRLLSGTGKILFVDSSQGFATLAVNERWRPLTANATRMRYQGISQLSTLAQAIKAEVVGSLGGKPFNFGNVKVIILDESTDMSYQDLVFVSRYRTEKDKDRDEPNENTWPDRNISYNRYREVIVELNALNVHIIHTGHVDQKKDRTNIEITRPSFGPKLYESLIQPMHMVGFVSSSEEVGKYIRRVRVQPTRTIIAKSRIDGLSGQVSFKDITEALGKFSEGKVAETEGIGEEEEFVGIEVD